MSNWARIGELLPSSSLGDTRWCPFVPSSSLLCLICSWPQSVTWLEYEWEIDSGQQRVRKHLSKSSQFRRQGFLHQPQMPKAPVWREAHLYCLVALMESMLWEREMERSGISCNSRQISHLKQKQIRKQGRVLLKHEIKRRHICLKMPSAHVSRHMHTAVHRRTFLSS